MMALTDRDVRPHIAPAASPRESQWQWHVASPRGTLISLEYTGQVCLIFCRFLTLLSLEVNK